MVTLRGLANQAPQSGITIRPRPVISGGGVSQVPWGDAARAALRPRDDDEDSAYGRTIRKIQTGELTMPSASSDDGGFWNSTLGSGLGILINNPITRTALKPLEVLDYGRRAITLGAEELAEGLSGAISNLGPEGSAWDNYWDQELGDPDDDRSNWDKLNDPTYGVGQLLDGVTGTKWGDRFVGLAGDLILDPLTWVGAGASVPGKLNRASSLTNLLDAQRAAERAGDAARIAELGGREAIERIGQRGLGTATAAQAEAMGLARPGLRFGLTPGSSVRIPGTEGVARAVNEAVGAARPIARSIPGAKALRNSRSPIGYLGNDLAPAYERVITGRGNTSLEGALEAVAMDDMARQAGGTFKAVSTDELERTRAQIKDLSPDEISDMARRGEELGEENVFTQLSDRIREVATFVGAEIPQLAGGRYVMPHSLNREFRNYLVDNASDPTVAAFRATAGIREQDLLEESGFLQRRAFRPKEDGSPAEFKIGDKTLVVEKGSVDELDSKLRELFPGYTGEIYERNPITAWRRYIDAVSKDVAKRSAGKQAAERGFVNVRHAGQAPPTFDPYAGRHNIVNAAGEPTQRVTRRHGQFQENEFYEGVEDRGATKRRNKAIQKSEKQFVEQYRTAGEAERVRIAAQIQADTEALLDPLRSARAASTDARRQATQRMERALAQGQATQELTDEALAGLRQTDVELEQLRKAEYGVKRTARSRTKREQKRLLDGLDAERRRLIAEQQALQKNYRTMSGQVQRQAEEAAKRVRREGRAAREAVSGAAMRAERRHRAAVEDVYSAWLARRGRAAPSPRRARAAAERLLENKPLYDEYMRLQETAFDIRRRVKTGQLTPERAEEQLTSINRKLTSQRFASLVNDMEVIEEYRQIQKTIEEVTGVERGAANQALREEGELNRALVDRARREMDALREAPTEVVEEAVKEALPANRYLDSRRGRELETARAHLNTYRSQVGKQKTKAAEKRLQKVIKEAQAEVDKLERNGWGAAYDRAKANRAAQAPQPETPTPQPKVTEHPMIEAVDRRAAEVASDTASVQSLIDEQTIPPMVEAEMGTAAAAQRMSDIGAGVDDEFTDIAARNREAAADRIEQTIEPQRAALRTQQDEYNDLLETLDAETGGAQQAYVEAMQDQGRAALEHARLSAVLDPATARRGRPAEIIEGKRGGAVSARAAKEASEGRIPFAAAQPLHNTVEDMQKLIDSFPGGVVDDEVLRKAQAALLATEQQLADLTYDVDIPLRETEAILKAAKDGSLAPVVKAKLRDNWRTLWDEGDVVISAELDRMFKNLDVMTRNPKAFGRAVEAFTNFFKTYATLTPGFHLRNAMSAVFMNYADGVATEAQMRGLRLWREYAKQENPLRWLTEQSTDVQNAFRAAFASGTGGRFLESGFADASRVSGKAKERIFDNRATRLSQRAGQDWVEGPLRLGMALDSVAKGGTVTDALQRISRIHFDYSQVSQLDEKAKRLIPFWTFMSRNLPMQLTQMWTKPKLYAQYESFVRNFRGDEQPGTPEYFNEIGAFPLGDTKIAGLPLFLQPDLPHLRLEEDVDRFARALSGENVGGVLTDVNPLFTAPLEFATGKDLFTGKEYGPDDLVPAQGLVNAPLGRLAQLLGQTETGASGQLLINEKFLGLVNSLVPVTDRASRVLPTLSTGNAGAYEGRQVESLARFLGIPIRQLSPQQQEATLRGQQYDLEDQEAMMRTLAQL